MGPQMWWADKEKISILEVIKENPNKILTILILWDNSIKCHLRASCHQDVQSKTWQLACHKTDFTNYQSKDVFFTCASVFFFKQQLWEKEIFTCVYLSQPPQAPLLEKKSM